MPKTIRARYRDGLIEPLESIDLADGAEITITVSELADISEDGLSKSFGGWRGLIDAEEFLRNVYADRRVSTRQRVKL
ncbi:antitoxin family protein [Candidatus Poribacteria bacterium]